MKRNVLTSPRLKELKKKKNIVQRRKFFFFLFIFVLILIGLSFLSRWDRINIDDVQIVGNKVIETEIIKKVVDENLSGYYFWIFPKTNLLIYPKKQIENDLAKNFKRLKDISIDIKNLTTLEVSLSERTPSFTWCGNVPLELNDNNQKCYFTDSNGYIFDEAPYFSGEVYFKFYGTVNNGDLSAQAGIPSGYYFSKENFEKLISLKKILEQIELKPVALFVVGDGDIKIFLSSKGTRSMGPEIRFKNNTDFNKVTENLQTALTTEPFQTEFKKNYSSLLYIDLRFNNKAIYKFK